MTKLIDVVHAFDHTGQSVYETEVGLVKLKCTITERTEILQIAELYSAKVVDYGVDSLIVRIVGAAEKLDVFLDLLRTYQIVELVRSGKITHDARPGDDLGRARRRMAASPDDVLAMMYFARVVEARSFTAAAAKLGVSKSVVSARIAAFERRLRTPLLHRTTRKLSLTREGVSLYERCARVAAAADEAAAAADRTGDVPHGLLRVDAPIVFAQEHLAAPLASYLEKHPQVRVALTMNDRIIDLVEEGVDVAVRITWRLAGAGLVARKLGSDRTVLCASPAYLARKGTPASPEELVHHDCLLYSLLKEATEWRFRAGKRSFARPDRGALLGGERRGVAKRGARRHGSGRVAAVHGGRRPGRRPPAPGDRQLRRRRARHLRVFIPGPGVGGRHPRSAPSSTCWPPTFAPTRFERGARRVRSIQSTDSAPLPLITTTAASAVTTRWYSYPSVPAGSFPNQFMKKPAGAVGEDGARHDAGDPGRGEAAAQPGDEQERRDQLGDDRQRGERRRKSQRAGHPAQRPREAVAPEEAERVLQPVRQHDEAERQAGHGRGAVVVGGDHPVQRDGNRRPRRAPCEGHSGVCLVDGGHVSSPFTDQGSEAAGARLAAATRDHCSDIRTIRAPARPPARRVNWPDLMRRPLIWLGCFFLASVTACSGGGGSPDASGSAGASGRAARAAAAARAEPAAAQAGNAAGGRGGSSGGGGRPAPGQAGTSTGGGAGGQAGSSTGRGGTTGAAGQAGGGGSAGAGGEAGASAGTGGRGGAGGAGGSGGSGGQAGSAAGAGGRGGTGGGSFCSLLAGMTWFVDDGPQSAGEARTAGFECRWRLSFTATMFSWQHSDYVRDRELQLQRHHRDGPAPAGGTTIPGQYDAASQTLTWDGLTYVAQ